MPEPRKRPRRPAPKKLVPAHPDLIPGLERLMDEGLISGWTLPSREDVKKNPTYQLVLHEMLNRKVPA